MMLSAVAAFSGCLCFAAAIAWAGVMDLSTMKIRNALVLFLLGSYAVLAPLAGIGMAEISWSAALALTILIGMFTFFSLGWIGGGDAKLASAAALWMGSSHVVDYLSYTALFGGALTFVILRFRSAALPSQWAHVPWIERLHASESGIPYGVAIAAGALYTFPNTLWAAAIR